MKRNLIILMSLTLHILICVVFIEHTHIMAANTVPKIRSSPLTITAEGHKYIYQVRAEDLDGDELRYSLLKAPEGMTIDSETGLISWTPTAIQAGSYEIIVRVTDSQGGEDIQPYTLAVAEGVNNTPEIISEPVIQGKEGEEYFYQVKAHDKDNNQLIYRLIGHPEGMHIDEVTGEIRWLPGNTDSGEQSVVIMVLDGLGGKVLQEFVVNIEEKINVSPLIISTPVKECFEGELYTYAVVAEDGDGDKLSYILVEGPEGMEIDSDTGLIQWVTDSKSAGEYVIKIKTIDPEGRFDIQKYLLTVLENINNDPIITSIPIKTVKEGERYIYSVEAEDADNDILTYFLNRCPEGMTIDENSGLIEWIPTGKDSGEYEIEILVNDGRGGSASQLYILIVEEAENTPPIIISEPLTVTKEEEEYVYSVEAEDADGDIIIYKLKEAPEGMIINESTGEIRWLPQRGQAGSYRILIEVSDGRGGVTNQEYTLTVESINNPPIIKGLEEISREGTIISYRVEALDPDGDILTYTLAEAPDGMTIDEESGIISWNIENVETGGYKLKICVTDPFAAKAEAEFTVEVNKNAPPVIISSPVIEGKVGQEYYYTVEAVDLDGDLLFYSLEEYPEGMAIDSSTGLISWIPTEEQVGEHRVRIRVEDGKGGFARQIFIIKVEITHNQEPIIISMPINNAKVNVEYIYQVIAEDPENDLLTYSLIEYPEGMSINSSTGLITWIPTKSQMGTNYVFVEVSDGKGGIATQAFTVYVSYDESEIDNIKPIVNIELSNEYVTVGSFVVIKLTSSDNIGIVSERLTVNAEEVILDENNKALYQSNVPGVFIVEGFAEDAAGNKGYDRKVLLFLTESDDTNPPTVKINTPEKSASLSIPNDIVGTVLDDSEILLYTLEYSPVGRDEYIEFARRESSVINDVLGQFDPTQLKNGYYDIRLTAIDTAGNVSHITTTYKVEGQLKIGNFSITFNDLSIPVTGIPITINRTYDSRNKSKGDFGYGWSIDINSITIEESIEPYAFWNYYHQEESILPFLPPVNVYYLEETREHKILVNYPDGRTDEFKMVVKPERQELLPISQVTVEYVAINGTTSKLEAIGDNLVIPIDYSYDGPGNVVLMNTAMELYNPDRYKLTQLDGTVLIINQNTGIEKIIDVNGNEIIFDEKGITHSAGKSILFTRDSEGRITCITDPAGNSITYTYDYYGDLVSVKDQAGYITSFTYNSSHELIDIINPRGVRAVRNEYDENGRLIAHIDADGNRIEFTHNIGDRQEIVKNRLGHIIVYDYDSSGNILQETDALGNVKKYTYDAHGNRTSETDALGNTTKYTYDEKGNMLTKTDPAGNTYTYTYDDKGNILTITDPNGNVSINEYDEKGNLIKDIDPEGNITTYSYDSAGNLIGKIDPLGNKTTYTFDRYGNLINETDPVGNTTKYTYDINGNRTSMTITRTTTQGLETLSTYYEYDSMNRLIKTVYPDGTSTTTEYNSIGKKSVEIDRLGRRTEYKYDNAGNLVRKIYPDGTEETYTYDAEGNRLTSTDRSGMTIKYEYDAVGNLIKTIYPDGTSTETVYDPVGRIKEVIDRRGNKTAYTYDSVGNCISVTDALGNTTIYEYNELNQMVKMIDAKGNITEYEYNKLGLRTRIIFPDGTTYCLEYDAAGNIINETDQAGLTTRYEYDELNRLVKVIDSMGNETVYTYDEAGNILSVTDANGNTTRYEYNQLGQRIKTILPLGMEETYTYDVLGNLLSVTDFNGNTITYEYDINNRMIKKTFPDGSTETYTYTETGNKETITTGEGTTRYVYDDNERLIRIEYPDGTEIKYTYDEEGNRTSVTVPSGTTRYTYDELNRLTTVIDPDGGITRYVYDANGNRSSVIYPNNTVTEYTYDSLNRLTELVNRKADGTIISSYRYILGPKGNRLKVEENNGRKVEYEYDELYRLIEERIFDPIEGYSTISYTYDAVGNRLTRNVDGVTIRYTYDDNNRLITEGETIYSYDDNGNMIGKIDFDGVINYFYDYQNRLIKVKTMDSTIEYKYNTTGIRTSVNVNGNIVNYLIDENRDYAQVLEERDNSSNLLASYIYGDDLISLNRGTGKSYYHYDGLGSTRALTNNAGTITDTYTYDAFGLLLKKTGDTENNYLYTGEQYDPNIGFYYLRARYMNPCIGRFINMDIWEGNIYDPVTLHKYLYANADPVNHIDPSGMFSLMELPIVQSLMSRLNNLKFANYLKMYWKMDTMAKQIEALNFARVFFLAMLSPDYTSKNSVNIKVVSNSKYWPNKIDIQIRFQKGKPVQIRGVFKKDGKPDIRVDINLQSPFVWDNLHLSLGGKISKLVYEGEISEIYLEIATGDMFNPHDFINGIREGISDLNFGANFKIGKGNISFTARSPRIKFRDLFSFIIK